MKRVLMVIALAIISIALQTQCAFAGAWTVPKHRTWGEFYQKWSYAKEYFNDEGEREKLGLGKDARNWEYMMEPKLEHGITDWLTGIFSLEYKEAHYKEYGRPDDWGPFVRKNHGLTNIKMGARLRLMKVPFVLSTQSKVFIYPGYGNYHGDDPAYTNQPGIGHGDDAFEQRILIGKIFSIPITDKFNLPCYAGAETGYRWRSRSVCNDIPYFGEFGFWPAKWLLLKAEIDGYKCQPGTGSIKESYGIVRVGGTWDVFGGDTNLRQGDKAFNVGFQYGATLWGKNTTAYQEFVLKVSTQF